MEDIKKKQMENLVLKNTIINKKTKYTTTLQSSNCIPGHFISDYEVYIRNTQKTCTNINDNFICNRQKLERNGYSSVDK